MKRWLSAAIIGALLLVWSPSTARAGAITFTGSAGSRAASLTFENSGTNLIVTLTNAAISDTLAPADVLTAVFFDVAGNPLLTRTSAIVPSGSAVKFGGTDAGGSVGGEWSYRNGLNQYGANSAISSTGVDLFGPGDRFPGSNLQGPESPDGVQYGITSGPDDTATGNTPVTGENALIQNQVVFTLGNWMLGDPTPHISNVTFQYGTSLGEPSVSGTSTPPSVPEPGALLLLGPAAALLVRRIRRAQKGRREATMPT